MLDYFIRGYVGHKTALNNTSHWSTYLISPINYLKQFLNILDSKFSIEVEDHKKMNGRLIICFGH